MSLGIGLGAFMNGFQGGLQARERLDGQRRERDNRKALDTIDAQAKEAYAVAENPMAGGTPTGQSYQQFWMKYALPRREAELLRQGDAAGAAAYRQWGESAAALEGGKLFSSALIKAQTGDAAGALDDAIKAAQTKGYMDSGYEIASKDEIRDPTGNVLGYRLKVRGPDGKEIMQDVAVGDVPRVVSQFVNPDAAWQSQQAARAAQSARGQEMADFEEKEKIKAKYDKGTDMTKAYMDAKKVRLENDLTGDFAAMPPEEQDKLIRQDLDAARSYGGTPGLGGGTAGGGTAPAPAPARKMVVDQTTGQPVQTPAAAAQPQPAPIGLGGDRIERMPLGQPDMTPRAASPSPGFTQAAERAIQAAPADGPRSTGAASLHPAQREMLQMAPQALAAGENPQALAQRLLNNGVPAPMWPVELQQALQSGGGTIGLGR